jgi:predicted phosphodiesterase
VLIAFFSDIHGNLPALKAAFADARARGALEIICAGDIVGYGPFPSEVCGFLAENNIESITGNYDCKVLAVLKQGKSAAAELPKKKREIVDWTADNISDNAKYFLTGLPECLFQNLPSGKSLLVVHGTPASNDDAIYPSITLRGLAAKSGETRVDVLVCGHTHIPFVKRVGGVLVINCGSVGQPVDGDPAPSYALLSVEKDALHARIVRFEYDVNETVTALKNTSLPAGLQEDFALGDKRRFL